MDAGPEPVRREAARPKIDTGDSVSVTSKSTSKSNRARLRKAEEESGAGSPVGDRRTHLALRRSARSAAVSGTAAASLAPK